MGDRARGNSKKKGCTPVGILVQPVCLQPERNVQVSKGLGIRNLTTGELLELHPSWVEGGVFAVTKTAEHRALIGDFAACMNREHRRGTKHVKECHDGQAQEYAIVEAELSPWVKDLGWNWLDDPPEAC